MSYRKGVYRSCSGTGNKPLWPKFTYDKDQLIQKEKQFLVATGSENC